MADENGSSRLDRIERAIENLSFQLENQRVNIESLHASVSELHGIAQAQNRTAEEHSRAIDKLLAESQRDAQNIRALARIAEIHERRLTDLEGRKDQ